MQTMSSFPYEALQHVLSLIDSHTDRNSVSLVCKSWYEVERCCRRFVYIRNCYSVSPPMLIRRFINILSISIKGKHRLADYDFVPEGWGGHAHPWIVALAAAYPALEKIKMTRMVVTDEVLDLIGKKLKNLKDLVLRRCEGFSTDGLASIATSCRKLITLDLRQSEVNDLGGNWITSFPESSTSLEFLNVDCLKSELQFSSLERLVGRCHNLKGLRLNRALPPEKLVNLLLKAPHLVDLGVVILATEPCPEACTKLADVFARRKGLKTLSGLCDADANPYYLPVIYPICSGLTSLNLTHPNLRSPDLVNVLRRCSNLRSLQVLDYVEDHGLEVVAASCKELQELRVNFSDPYDIDPSINLTEQGLVAVAVGCPKLHLVVYCCNRMTNAALRTIAKHKPNLTCFRLIIFEPLIPDYLTHEPFDNGFSAIIEHCKNLRFLVLTGLVTDGLLEHIGIHGKKLESLHLAFSGNSDLGLHHILSGCTNLRKLSARDCPFDGQALLKNSSRLEMMQSLWMSSCLVTYQTCKQLGEKLQRLNVEVISGKEVSDSMSDECLVESLYVYRTVAGPRLDTPSFVLQR